jgi:hypothetical protein
MEGRVLALEEAGVVAPGEQLPFLENLPLIVCGRETEKSPFFLRAPG